MTIGIYKLEFAGTSKCYIGQSLNIEMRFKQHLNLMRKQESSIKLNQAYLDYGNPTLEIILECGSSELDSTEQEAIEIYNSVVAGFNTCLSAGGKTSLQGEQHPRCAYTNEQLKQVLILLVTRLDMSLEAIAEETSVSKNVVTNISCLNSHHWLKDCYLDIYSKLEIISENNLRRLPTKNGPKSETFKVFSPTGEIHIITNITTFAKQHSLDKSHVSKLRSGERKSHKGWKLCPEV